MKKRLLLFVPLFTISCFLLFIYSFSQVDLNLTLSTNSSYQFFQSQLTKLGYFYRPLSTAIYILIILLLSFNYLLLAKQTKNKQISSKQIWFLVILGIVILLFSYPAFSHDVFNYMFDARIVTKYNLSPWHYKALDFPSDQWIRFMRWTHRPSVYPPVWIGLSAIPSLLGLGKFSLTLSLFKLMASCSYLGSSWLIFKISQRLKLKNPLLALVLFAFNPLIIVESLVNAHMEITMVYFGLLSFYLLLKQKKILSWVSYLLSVGIKFMTAYLAVILIKGKKYLKISLLIGMLTSLGFIFWYGFQPWYLLWTLPFSFLLPRPSLESQILNIASISSLVYYIPLVLWGDFELPEPSTRLIYYTFIPFILLCLVCFLLPKIAKSTKESK